MADDTGEIDREAKAFRALIVAAFHQAASETDGPTSLGAGLTPSMNPDDAQALQSLGEDLVDRIIAGSATASSISPLNEIPPVSLPLKPKPQHPGKTPWRGRRPAAGILLAIGAASIMSLAACVAIMFYINMNWRASHSSQIADGQTAKPASPSVTQPVQDPTPVAEVSAVARAVWEQGDSADPGTELASHRLLRLRSGGAEILFNSGARVVLEGPAVFRLDGPNRGSLDYGKLVAHVPPPARGFAIATPGALITDHGTVFGVNVSNTGSTLVHMYEGTADVAVRGSDPQAAPSPVSLQKGNVVAQDAAGSLVWLDTTDPRAFPDEFATELREIRQPLALHNTGMGLTVGTTDPNWQIIATPPESKFKHGNAIVSKAAPYWRANAPRNSQWISVGGNAPAVDAGDFTFSTTVDLTGFDPKTVRIHAEIIADDAISDILVNGNSTGLRVPFTSAKGFSGFHSVNITTGFAAGVNQIDFVVWNQVRPADREKFNRMGLRVEWEGEAVPEIER